MPRIVRVARLEAARSVVQLSKERHRLPIIRRAARQVATEVARHAEKIERFCHARPVSKSLKDAQGFLMMSKCFLGAFDVEMPVPQTIEAVSE